MSLSNEVWVLAGIGAFMVVALWAMVYVGRVAMRSLLIFSRMFADLAETLRGIEARLSELRDLIATIRSGDKTDRTR